MVPQVALSFPLMQTPPLQSFSDWQEVSDSSIALTSDVSDMTSLRVRRLLGAVAPNADCVSDGNQVGVAYTCFQANDLVALSDSGLASETAYSYRLCIRDTSGNVTSSNVKLSVMSGGALGGAEAHMRFVANSVFPSSFGGVQNADNLCFTLAGQGTKTRLFITATWKAVLSDSSEQAKDRVTILGDVKNTVGNLIGRSQSIFGGSLTESINFDENGMPVTDSTIWTGPNPGGTAAGDSNCTDWTGVGISGGVGLSSSFLSSWLGASSSDCESSHPLYCISQ